MSATKMTNAEKGAPSPLEVSVDRSHVQVGAALAHAITTVTKADVSLSTSLGELSDNQRVLVPFLELALSGSASEEGPLWVGRLTMDNVAFLLEQVAVGLLGSLDALEAMSLGDLRPTATRIEYSADRAASAGESLREAAAKLRTMAARAI